MHKIISKILGPFLRAKPLFLGFVVCALFTESAQAKDLIEAFNLAPIVPLVLDVMMTIATSLYKFFVGNGNGIIYILIYLFLGFYIALYLVKMYFPKDWLGFFGFSGGGEIWDGTATGWSIANNVMKPCVRAIVAVVILLQIKPTYVTEWVVNPFLEFGAVYTESILKTINGSTITNVDSPVCPASIKDSGWISQEGCKFLVQPVYTISAENNKVIKYGFGFLKTGLRQLMTLFLHGGEGLLNVITGILLISAFVSANVFMALLIIQAIFDLCIALIMYPFNVLAWVAKKSDKWFDIWPAFSQIIDALKKLVITMIACAFILCINIALVHALFNWYTPTGGGATTNLPSITNTATNFGQHFMLWLSAVLTFFIMHNIFITTRQRLEMYTSGTKHDFYDKTVKNASTAWGKIKSTPDSIKKIIKIKDKFKGS